MVKAVFACFYALCPPFGLPKLPVQLAEHIPVVILFRTDNIRFDFNDCRIQHMCRTALRQRLYENADPHPLLNRAGNVVAKAVRLGRASMVKHLTYTSCPASFRMK